MKISRRGFLGGLAALPLAGCPRGEHLRSPSRWPRTSASPRSATATRTTSTARRSSSAAAWSTASRCSTSTAAWRRAAGKSARGFGSMPLGNVWAFPSKTMSYDTTLGAMKALAERIDGITAGVPARPATPSTSSLVLEPEYLRAAADVSTRARARRADPEALHARRRQPVRRRPPRRLRQGPRPERYAYLRPRLPAARPVALPRPGVPRRAPATGTCWPEPPSRACRCTTSSARSTRSSRRDVEKPIGDGLPETLPEWIDYNGLAASRSSSTATTSRWDVERTLARRPRRGGGAGAARGHGLALLARLQRALPERRATCSTSCGGSARARRRGFDAHPLRRAADGARPAGQPRATSCTRRRSCGRW